MVTAKPGRFHLFAEIISELRKVVWPSRQEAMRLTIMVIAVSVAVGLLLGLVDVVFTELVKLFLGR